MTNKKEHKIFGPGRLSAGEQLAVRRDYPGLVPGLCARGLGIQDALALAHNAALLYHALAVEPVFASPEEVFSRLSLEEIAVYAAECAEIQAGTLEVGWNAGFEEGGL